MNKSALREELFKLLYSLEVQKDDSTEEIDTYVENIQASESDKKYISTNATKIREENTKLKEEISKNLKNDWNIERVSKINLAILKLAIYEILYTDTPYKVSINEAVEIAKKYGEDQSPSFVNGILASVVKNHNIS